VSFLEIFLGILLVIVLLGLAFFYARRQFQARLALARDRTMPEEERTYLMKQSRRRLICSVLMILFALFLIGWFVIEANLPDLKQVELQDKTRPQPLLELLAYYWITALLVLFGIFVLGGIDFFATARFALRQKKLLDSERRAALEMEAQCLRDQLY
jgi:hypothetical protein